MKYFKAALVVVLVFLFPLGSYLYIKSGFNYRKAALAVLKNEVPLSPNQLSIIEKTTPIESIERYNKGVSLFQYVSNEKDIQDMNFVADNLNVRSDFQILAFSDVTNNAFLIDTTYSKTITRIAISKDDKNVLFESNRFLLSKDGFIRKTYGESLEDVKTMYEHAVILLPVKKRDKVSLKRKTDN